MTSSTFQDRPITLRDLNEALRPILEILQRHEARFDAIEKRLDKIEDRLDKIEEVLNQHTETLKQHGEILKDHGDRLSVIEETIKIWKKYTITNSSRLDRIEKTLEDLRNNRFNDVLTLQDQLITMIKNHDMEDLMTVGRKNRHEEMLEDHEKRLRAIERN